jgi:hypothetical protein
MALNEDRVVKVSRCIYRDTAAGFLTAHYNRVYQAKFAKAVRNLVTVENRVVRLRWIIQYLTLELGGLKKPLERG